MVDRSCNRNTLLETARAERADKSDMLFAALEVSVSGIRNVTSESRYLWIDLLLLLRCRVPCFRRGSHCSERIQKFDGFTILNANGVSHRSGGSIHNSVAQTQCLLREVSAVRDPDYMFALIIP